MSNKLTKEQVRHIAKLARIGLNEKDMAKFQEDLGAVLIYIDKLKEVDASEVAPISHITGLENATRNDETAKEAVGASAEELIKAAPNSENGYVRVQQVLNK